MRTTSFAALIVWVAVVSGVLAQERDLTRYRAAAVSEIPTEEREIIHYRVYGEGVTTEFVTVDTSTCDLGVQTIVTVHGGQGIVYVNGEATESNIVSVVASVYDRCAELLLSLVTGTGPADQLHVNPGLKSASLRTSIEGTDRIHGNPVPITVDLVWNGAGQPDRSSDQVRYNVGVQLYVSNSTGAIRNAVAGGTVTVGGLDVTPLPSIYGVIEKDSTRTLSFYR